MCGYVSDNALSMMEKNDVYNYQAHAGMLHQAIKFVAERKYYILRKDGLFWRSDHTNIVSRSTFADTDMSDMIASNVAR